LISLGKYLEARAKGQAGAAIERLLDLTPKTARRCALERMDRSRKRMCRSLL
jgi:Cation transport ATPase